MAINTTNLVKFKVGNYQDTMITGGGRDVSTLYFAKHDASGIGGLWLGDHLISSQVVDAQVSADGKTLTITKLNTTGSNPPTTSVSINLTDIDGSIGLINTRLSNIEGILDRNQTTTSNRLNTVDGSIAALESNKADKTENWWSFTGGADASAKLDGIEAGAQVNKLEAVKLNDSFVTIQTDAEHGKYVDLSSIATSTATEAAMTEAKKHSVVEEGANNLWVKVVPGTDTSVGGKTYIVDDSSLRAELTDMDSDISDAQEAADNAQQAVDDLSTFVGTIPAGATATTVTGYVDEKIADVSTLAVVNVEKQATAESGFAATYVVTQNGTQVGSKINIPKDFLVKSASVETVSTANDPYAGAAVGDKYIDFVVNTVDASETAQHIYLPVNDLVDVYTATNQTSEVTVAIDSNNNITASIGSIDANKINWYDGTRDTDVSTALADLYSQIGAGGSVATQIQEAVEALDSSVTATGTAQNNGVFVISKVNEVDGLLDQSGSTFVEVEQAGAAAGVKSTIDAYTVNGKAISTSPVLDGSDINVDSTAATPETVKAAIERLDAAIGVDGSVGEQIDSKINALDSTVTASGTASNNGIFVLSKVNQTDGKLDPVEANKSEAVEVWAAADSQAVANALTWGTFN